MRLKCEKNESHETLGSSVQRVKDEDVIEYLNEDVLIGIWVKYFDRISYANSKYLNIQYLFNVNFSIRNKE